MHPLMYPIRIKGQFESSQKAEKKDRIEKIEILRPHPPFHALHPFSNAPTDFFIKMRGLFNKVAGSVIQCLPEAVVKGAGYQTLFVTRASRLIMALNRQITAGAGFSCSKELDISLLRRLLVMFRLQRFQRAHLPISMPCSFSTEVRALVTSNRFLIGYLFTPRVFPAQQRIAIVVNRRYIITRLFSGYNYAVLLVDCRMHSGPHWS